MDRQTFEAEVQRIVSSPEFAAANKDARVNAVCQLIDTGRVELDLGTITVTMEWPTSEGSRDG